MNNIFGDDEELLNLEEITGAQREGAPAATFAAWHKPRKQFVRKSQWWFHLEYLLTRYPEYEEIETIKYFGLPGSDLLDVSYFSRQLSLSAQYSNKKIFVHGFIDSAKGKEAADLRLSALLDRDNVDSGSKVDHFNFQAIAASNSLAYRKIKNTGAYHLVNLDFCDGVFKQTTIDSMMNLLVLQLNKILDTPWLLFLTTRADKSGITQELMAALAGIFSDGVKSDQDFLKAIEEFGERIRHLIPNTNDINDEEVVSASELSEILQVCFVFWLIKTVHAYDGRMEITSSMKYKVHEGNDFPDMYSYVIRITKKSLVKPDELGLAKAPAVSVGNAESSKVIDKTKAVEKLCKALDIDDLLSKNLPIRNECADEMKRLLEEAGWNTVGYDAQMGIDRATVG